MSGPEVVRVLTPVPPADPGGFLTSPTRVFIRVEFGDGSAAEIETKGRIGEAHLDAAVDDPAYHDLTLGDRLGPSIDSYSLALAVKRITPNEHGEAYVVRLLPKPEPDDREEPQ